MNYIRKREKVHYAVYILYVQNFFDTVVNAISKNKNALKIIYHKYEKNFFVSTIIIMFIFIYIIIL